MATPPRHPGLRERLFGDLWPLAPSLESRSILSLKPAYGHFIDGDFVYEGDLVDSVSPTNGEVLAQVHQASDEIVDRAVRAAHEARQKVWGPMKPSDRARYLYRIARLIQEHSRELAVLESLDGGKPIRESRDIDVPLVAAHFFYYAGWADKLDYAFPGGAPEAVGVAGQIIPWNFPLLMAAWKIAPALAAGCTVVLKPAEWTPLSAARLAEIFQEAGLPPGVVNIIQGGGSAGAAIAGHSLVNKVAFTGSTRVGKLLQSQLAGTGRRLTLELGGKGANIVFDDAPLDEAVEGIIQGIFFNQGHVCCAGSRLLVQESIHDEVIARLQLRMQTLRVGDPLDKNTDVGAINNPPQLARINELVDDSADNGCQVWQPDGDLPAEGYYYKPTLLLGATSSIRAVQEEIFGPVLSVMTFRTPEEAVARANQTQYGLSAGIWSDKGSKLLGTMSKMQAGVVWGNSFNRFDPTSPFGGFKESGFGREGGRHGLLPYLEV